MTEHPLTPCPEAWADQNDKIHSLTSDLVGVWLEMFNLFRDFEQKDLWDSGGDRPSAETLGQHQEMGRLLNGFGQLCAEFAAKAEDPREQEIRTWLTFVADSMQLWHAPRTASPARTAELEALFNGNRS